VLVRRIRAEEWQPYREIRLAALADAPDAFGSTLAAEAERPDHEWRARSTSAAAGSDRATFVLVDADDRWHGLAGGFRPGDPPADVELVSMWVAPPTRRSGYAQALVLAVTGWARETGGGVVGLWVTAGNAAAIGLYERCGFVANGERKPLPSNPDLDELRMLLTI
jgi:ribosomal protein S18 acetylase RimI-like enzyme